jgi:hypothetical protein
LVSSYSLVAQVELTRIKSTLCRIYLANGLSDGVHLTGLTTTGHANADIDVGELIKADDEEGLVDLEAEDGGFDEAEGLSWNREALELQSIRSCVVWIECTVDLDQTGTSLAGLSRTVSISVYYLRSVLRHTATAVADFFFCIANPVSISAITSRHFQVSGVVGGIMGGGRRTPKHSTHAPG